MTADRWQERHAAALDHEAAEIDKLLAELDNGHAIAEMRGNAKLCSETRAMVSVWRAEQTAMRNEARELRSEPSAAVLPMSLTTRTVRRDVRDVTMFTSGGAFTTSVEADE